jgi:hypothetical protein
MKASLNFSEAELKINISNKWCCFKLLEQEKHLLSSIIQVERLRYPILSRIRTYLYQQLLRIWKRALDFVGGGFSAAGPLLTTNLVRLHKNSGHASYTDMRNCLLRAKLWSEEEHSDALKEIIRECPCEKARKPSTPPKVSLSRSPRARNSVCTLFIWWAPILTCRGQVLRLLCLCLFKRHVNFDKNSCLKRI